MNLRTLAAALCLGAPVLLQSAETHRYTYDAAGRLVAAQEVGGGGVRYRWDAAGNLVERSFEQNVDSDADGLPDGWEHLYFASLERDGAGDFDGDSLSDAAEFRAGTDPTKPGSVLRIVQARVDATQRLEIVFVSVPGRRYRVEWTPSISPASWVGLAEVDASAASTAWSGPIDARQPGYLRLVVLP